MWRGAQHIYHRAAIPCRFVKASIHNLMSSDPCNRKLVNITALL